jgi:hypothetical protein
MRRKLLLALVVAVVVVGGSALLHSLATSTRTAVMEQNRGSTPLEWQAVVSEEGGYRLEMPGKATPLTREVTPAPGTTIHARGHLVERPELPANFFVFSYVVPNPPPAQDVEPFLEATCRGIREKRKGNLRGERPLTLDSVQGREIIFQFHDYGRSNIHTGRVYYAQPRLYVTSVVTPEPLADETFVKKCLDSFTLQNR